MKEQKQLQNNKNTYISFFEWKTPSGDIYNLSVRHNNNEDSFIRAFASEYGSFHSSTYIMGQIYLKGESGPAYHIPTLTADAEAIKQCLRETVADIYNVA